MHLQIKKRDVGFDKLKCVGFTMKISSRGHRLLIYIVKRNTRTVGMGPSKVLKTIEFGGIG